MRSKTGSPPSSGTASRMMAGHWRSNSCLEMTSKDGNSSSRRASHHSLRIRSSIRRSIPASSSLSVRRSTASSVSFIFIFHYRVFFGSLLEGRKELTSYFPAVACDFITKHRTHDIHMRLDNLDGAVVLGTAYPCAFVEHLADNADQGVAEGSALAAQFVSQHIDFLEVNSAFSRLHQGLGAQILKL